MAYLKGLQADIANIKSLGFVSRDIDAFFLNELNSCRLGAGAEAA